jgi:hypothetical protein
VVGSTPAKAGAAQGQAVGGALEALLQLGLEAVELVGGEVAVAGGVDEGAGGAGGVVEEGLVPLGRGVVDVDGGGGGLDGGEAVVRAATFYAATTGSRVL